ncbi:Transcriptional regulator, MarR family [Serinicoccus hydrothermalis]|uniref:Transcriptional regulator, MarR family n=1 Tax=Serinicoccus hydrothermalis TaxID=1758689 RepID=A0A1B1NBH8_9MICO|nr:MarR family transcriptional regulator [Serinicoccus hydrothermalis]ANS78799.1 Transcriptional regulator, MarR family [Serinicoccus hydrothermalis]
MPDTSPDPATAALAHDLRIACMRVARRVRFDAGNTIAPHHFSVLVRLSEQERTLGELAGIEQVSPPSMSRTVGQLTELGYVDRATDADDGRLVRLSLTDEGLAVVTRERELRDAWMAARLEGLSGVDRELLRRATDLIEGLLATATAGQPDRASQAPDREVSR